MATYRTRKTSDGKIRHQAIIRLKGYPQESATFERRTDAKKWAQQTEAAMIEGRYFKTTEAKKHTLAELIDRYLRDVLPQKSEVMSKQTVQFKWWKKQIGHHLLSDVTPAVISEYRDKLANTPTPQDKRRSPSTVNRYLAALSHALNIAVNEWGWMDDSPMRKVAKLKEPKGIVRFLNDQERGRLLTACQNSSNKYLYTVVVLALSTGARKMEILGLRWKDIDLQRDAIMLLDTKNGESRSLPLKSHARDLIEKLSKVRRLDTDLLFPGNNPQTPVELRKHWVAALKEAEIENFRFHDLRHSAASCLAMNGATNSELASVLGHKTLQMVKRYAHLSESHSAGIVEKMNNKIFNGDAS